RLRDVADAHPQIAGARAIDHHAQFRLAGDERGIDVDHVGQRLQPGQHVVRVFRQLVEVRPADDKLNVGVAEAAAGDGRDRVYRGSQLRHFLQILSDNL